MLEIPTQINSTSTKTIQRVDRYVEQHVKTNIWKIKKNYLNDNPRRDYIK